MDAKFTTTVWAIGQGVRFAWAIARTSERLGSAGARFDTRLNTIAAMRGVDMLDLLAPLNAPLGTT
jgi:hypothetical protein